MQIVSRDRDWLIPVAVLVAVKVAVAMWLSPIGGLPTLGAFAILALTIISVVIVVRLLLFLARLAREGEQRPLQRVRSVVVQNSGRGAAVLTAVYLSALSGSAFSTLKDAIPVHNPFWLDLYLAPAESMMGIHPWQVTHALFGWATPVIDLIYASWLPVTVIAYYLVLLSPSTAAKSQALISQALIWLVLGVFGAYLGSSVGPIFYDRVFGGAEFAALNAAITADAPVALRTSDMLWRSYTLHTSEVGSGISAMPSLHVTMAFWLCMVVRRTRWAPLAWAYYCMIFLGSVHLGWHYAADGLVGTAGALVLWWLAGQLRVPSIPYLRARTS